MNVPQMPRMWMCIRVIIVCRLGPPVPASGWLRYFGKRSRNFNFQNLPVDVRGTASMNS